MVANYMGRGPSHLPLQVLIQKLKLHDSRNLFHAPHTQFGVSFTMLSYNSAPHVAWGKKKMLSTPGRRENMGMS